MPLIKKFSSVPFHQGITALKTLLCQNYYSIIACQNKLPCKGILNFPKFKTSFHGINTQNYQKKLA